MCFKINEIFLLAVRHSKAEKNKREKNNEKRMRKKELTETFV